MHGVTFKKKLKLIILLYIFVNISEIINQFLLVVGELNMVGLRAHSELNHECESRVI